MYEVIKKGVDNAVLNFNKHREKLPLFNESLGNIISQCSKVIDFKINELLYQFYYSKKKLYFNSDIIFSFLTKNDKIYKHFGSKLNDINIKLRELCNIKAKEYDLLVKQKKPEWNKTKLEKN